MSAQKPASGHLVSRNPGFDPEVIDASDVEAAGALDEMTQWPGYAMTPLIPLPGLAADLGVAALWYKDEGPRFGIGSFKPMGGGYAVARVVARHVEVVTGRPRVTSAQLLAGTFRDLAEQVTVACATDGNHGRAVAWAARLFGCRAVVYLANHVTTFRERAIAAYGAEVRRSEGNHDDAVREMALEADRRSWQIISETARASDPRITRDIITGYGALAHEIASQLGDDQTPTHVLVQTGVGGLAAGFIANAKVVWPDHPPHTVVVEALDADCVRRSLEASERAAVTGALDTVMAGLAAGVVSEMAWPYLKHGAFAAISIADRHVAAALKQMWRHGRVEVGESGVAGIAALQAVVDDPDARRALDLNADARVVTLGTEGVTDPEVWERLVGRAPGRVYGKTP